MIVSKNGSIEVKGSRIGVLSDLIVVFVALAENGMMSFDVMREALNSAECIVNHEDTGRLMHLSNAIDGFKKQYEEQKENKSVDMVTGDLSGNPADTIQGLLKDIFGKEK